MLTTKYLYDTIKDLNLDTNKKIPNIDEYNAIINGQSDEYDEALLNIRNLLMNRHVQQAHLFCPGCDRIYIRIKQGIPNICVLEKMKLFEKFYYI